MTILVEKPKVSIYDAPQDCIRTNSGIYINVFETTPEMICIEDIAHSLSRLPRFGGHANRHYSVAQHSVLGARRLKDLLSKKKFLLHDGSEAYMLDIPTPIKHKLGDYQYYENELMKMMFGVFGLEYPLTPDIKQMDKEMLLYEWDNLIAYDNPDFKCWTPNKAKKEFLKMYHQLFTV